MVESEKLSHSAKARRKKMIAISVGIGTMVLIGVGIKNRETVMAAWDSLTNNLIQSKGKNVATIAKTSADTPTKMIPAFPATVTANAPAELIHEATSTIVSRSISKPMRVDNMSKLDLIRQYCDTSGVHLKSSEKDLLCKILENPYQYDGFTSSLKTDTDSGRDFRDTWTSATYTQYRINIDSRGLSIDERYKHTCSDGYENDRNWEWENAYHFTAIRDILRCLKAIASEL